MGPREGVLLVLTTAAAFAAALTCRVATAPGEIAEPLHARAFEEVRRRLPAAGALHVRSALPDAASRLREASLDVLDPARAALEFRYGRLRFATPDEVLAAKADLERGVVPALPPAPDVRGLFRDGLGPYTCDVLPEEDGDVERARAALPGASFTGEPAARAAEEDARRDVTRALVAGLAAVCAGAAFRRRGVEAEARLFAALLPLAILGVAGLSVDAWSVPALLLVAAAPRGAPLLCAAPCLLFPSLALRRIGVILLVGGLLRWGPPAGRPRGGATRALLVPLLLAGAALPLARRALPPAWLPPEVRHEPAVTLVEPGRRAERAREMRALGFASVVGAEPTVPPLPDAVTLRHVRRMHFRAKEIAARAAPEERARWMEVSEAAAVEGLHEPRDVRRRLRSQDRLAALWGYGLLPVDDLSFTGAALYRVRGQDALRRQAVEAALAAFALAGTALVLWRGRSALLPLLARAGGVVLAFAALQAAHRTGQPAAAECLLPVAVAASFAVPWLLLAGVLAGAPFLGASHLHVAVALLAATALGFIRR